MPRRPVPAIFPLLILTLALAGCDQTATSSTRRQPDEPGPPAKATYRCEEGGTLSIERSGANVAVLTPDGEQLLLPASPAGQTMRYGEPPYALVLDPAEALYMKGGAEPVTCRR